jgi:hypothetical protein
MGMRGIATSHKRSTQAACHECLHEQAQVSNLYLLEKAYVEYDRMPIPSRRFVARRCGVCEWSGAGLELGRPVSTTCPICHAPTSVTSEELLVPLVSNKNPIATALSRLGASKGGLMRAKGLSPARRSEIARAAAAARWRRRR